MRRFRLRAICLDSGRARANSARQSGEGPVNRRDFVKLGGVAALELGAAKLLLSQMQPGMQSSAPATETTKADFSLRIAPFLMELTPAHTLIPIGSNVT